MFRCSTAFRVRLPIDIKPTGKQKQQAPSKGGRPRGSVTQRRIVLWSLSEFGLLWRGPSNSTGIHTENKQWCTDCHRRSLQGRQHTEVPRLLCQLSEVFSLGGELQSVQQARWPCRVCLQLRCCRGRWLCESQRKTLAHRIRLRRGAFLHIFSFVLALVLEWD